MQTLILGHYPSVIRQIKEIQQIAKAEDLEFSKLNASIDQTLKNMFVFTADETGVFRFEKQLGITPKPGQSLEDRKMYILSMMNRRKMSLSELRELLSSYSKEIEISIENQNGELSILAEGSEAHIQTLHDILEEMLPLQVYIFYRIKVNLWRMDGSIKMDGRRTIDAKIVDWKKE